MAKKALLVVNFGGPRNLEEVQSFLEELLTDNDVIRTPIPNFIQNYLFRKVAEKRASKVSEDYAEIGGKSPIYEDTQWVTRALEDTLNLPTLSFHRYLRATHRPFVKAIEEMDVDEWLVFPMYPQFSYATTGSIARWFDKYCTKSTCKKMQWIKSYPIHESFIHAFVKNIREFLEEKSFKEEETVLLFSAHGVPESFVKKGDPYQKECKESFAKIAGHFPQAKSLLSYQSKFGRAKWIEPSTISMCDSVKEWIEDKKQIVFIPLSFTSDHIETLFEIEDEYIKPLKEAGFNAYRCPALGRRHDWIEGIKDILAETDKVRNTSLIRCTCR